MSGLRAELARGARTTRFAMAVARQLVMLAGVFVLDWSPVGVAVFFLLEAFLFLALRGAAEIAVDDRLGSAARGPVQAATQIALALLLTAPVMGCIVGAFGVFALMPFGELPFSALRTAAREPSFLVAIALLAGSVAYETALFARRVMGGRGPEELARDEMEKKLVYARLLYLVLAAFTMGVLAQVTLGPPAIALAVAAVSLFLEAAPQWAARSFKVH